MLPWHTPTSAVIWGYALHMAALSTCVGHAPYNARCPTNLCITCGTLSKKWILLYTKLSDYPYLFPLFPLCPKQFWPLDLTSNGIDFFVFFWFNELTINSSLPLSTVSPLDLRKDQITPGFIFYPTYYISTPNRSFWA